MVQPENLKTLSGFGNPRLIINNDPVMVIDELAKTSNIDSILLLLVLKLFFFFFLNNNMTFIIFISYEYITY